MMTQYLNALGVAAALVALSACSSGGSDPMDRQQGSAAFDALKAERQALFQSRLDNNIPGIGINEFPMSGTATYAGALTYQMFPATNDQFDFPADFEAAARLTMSATFDGYRDPGADPITAVASNFVTNAGENLTGTLRSAPMSSVIDFNRIFPVGVTMTGVLTQQDGTERETTMTISGSPSGTGASHISGAIGGEMVTNGRKYVDLEGAFETTRQ